MTQPALKTIDVTESPSPKRAPRRERAKTGTAVQKAVPVQSTEVAVAAPPDPLQRMLDIIETGMRDPQADPERIERWFALAEKLRLQDAERQFDAALADAQEKMKPIQADAKNDQTKSRYATYAALDGATRPLYTAAGFSCSYNTDPRAERVPENHIRVVMHLAHKCGFKRLYEIDMPVDGKGPKENAVMSRVHATGSGVSYGMRYLQIMAFNLAIFGKKEDDDGNKAGKGGGPAISEEEADVLTKRLTKVQADFAMFCEAYNINSVTELPKSKLEEVHTLLDQKAKRKV